ncbi:MAG: glycoside hydrolase domain-containing protein [Jatrophihabitans sp.]
MAVQHRRVHRPRVPMLLMLLAGLLAVIGCQAQRPAAPSRTGSSGSAVVSSPPTRAGSPSQSRTASADPPSSPARPAVHTPAGLWWGVDSSGPITAAALANVRDWYQGATPQFWGRYVGGHYGLSAAELSFARQHGIYVYLLINDRNCSQCGGTDICGNDRTAGQARADALDAIHAAAAVGVRRGAVLFKDIEQVSSCRGEPTAAYLDAWYRTVRGTDYRTGFYGNVHQQNYDFPRAYCAAHAHAADFARDVVLDMNEDEPRLGALRGSTGPHNAPAFAPKSPACAAPAATVIWQYGESIDRANYTDIDQARPGLHGLLAPDGSIS